MWNLPDLFFVPFDTGAILRRASLPVGAQPELEAITLEEAETVRRPTRRVGRFRSIPASPVGLPVDRLLECRNPNKNFTERWRSLIEHHRRHRPIVRAQVLDPGVVRHKPQRPRPSRVVAGSA